LVISQRVAAALVPTDAPGASVERFSIQGAGWQR
jgi:hypothetical protein